MTDVAELVALYDRLAEHIAASDHEAAAPLLRPRYLDEYVEADQVALLPKQFPPRAGAEVVHEDILAHWACLAFRTTDRPNHYFVRLVFFERREGWRVTSTTKTRVRRVGEPEADRAELLRAVRSRTYGRPEPETATEPLLDADLPPLPDAPLPCASPRFATAEARDVTPCPESEVEALERRLTSRTPAGYREFATRFGEALYGDWVRVYPPKTILQSLSAWRERVAEHDFWTEHSDALDHATLVRCIPIADSMEGDEIVFAPTNPRVLYGLPRHTDDLVVLDDLDAALDWLMSLCPDPAEPLTAVPLSG